MGKNPGLNSDDRSILETPGPSPLLQHYSKDRNNQQVYSRLRQNSEIWRTATETGQFQDP